MTTVNDDGSPTGGAAAAGAAREQAQHTAGVAAEEGRHVAGVAQDEAQRVARDAAAQLTRLWDETSAQVLEQSRAGLERVVDLLRRAGDDLEQMVGANPGSTASRVAEQAGEWARSLSARLEGRDPRELLEQVRELGRRKPGTFLAGALAAGALTGRAARGTRDAGSSGGQTPGGGPAVGAATAGGQAPLIADVTSPGAPLSEGREAPSSGPLGDVPATTAGTATGDPLAGVPTPDDTDTGAPPEPPRP